MGNTILTATQTILLLTFIAAVATAQSNTDSVVTTPDSETAKVQEVPKFAETVFRSGAVYTVDASRSWAETVAVRGGRIVYVGSDAGVTAWIGPATRSIDLQGKMLLPGFHDSHVHLIGGGIELGECDINGLTSVDQILAAVKRYADLYPDRKWIKGGGWPLTLEEGNPHKSLLDKVVSDRPIMLDAFDGHSVWVNSKALEIAGITKETPDPARGRIEREPKTGEPTGTYYISSRGFGG